MSPTLPTTPEPITPTKEDAALARELSRRLAVALETDRPLRIRVGDGDVEELAVPVLAVGVLFRALAELGRGHAVAVLPIDAELSAEQAAEVLNASVAFVDRLIGEGKLPAHKDQDRTRVRLEDVLAFKRQIDSDRLKALEELTAQAQELKMGY